MKIDNTDTEQNCAKQAKQKMPKATGAKWEPSTNKCWAEFGSKIVKAHNLRACLFKGKILPIFVINTI